MKMHFWPTQLFLFLWLGSLCAAPVQNDHPSGATVNRTVPQVALPTTGLKFSASPTVQEISRARVFEEPLVPIGGKPSVEENAALATALLGYAKRNGPDDFSSPTHFLEQHPQSPWRAALLTDLGLEYYRTAHYSLALEAWQEAWALAKDATDRKAKAVADRAGGELAFMYARLGRMTDLEALLNSVEGRTFIGAATERITGAREGLWSMQHTPEVSFKCGPYALLRILVSDQKLLASVSTNALKDIFDAASTTNGFSLPQVAALSRKVGLNYQMAFRTSSVKRSSRRESVPSGKPEMSQSGLTSAATSGGESGEFIVPSVVHWKVGHYAALVRQEGDRYLLEDPTFGNTVWATRQALEAETSGYFLIPPGDLPRGWRRVDNKEGASVWGKGHTSNNDPSPTGSCDLATRGGACSGGGCGVGMAVSRVHLMTVNLNIVDTPVGYSPPVGFPVHFTVRYSHRDAFQPANFTYSNFGPKWTCDWISYITDDPTNTLADVKYYMRGGGTRTFTGFDTNTQTFAFQLYDQTLLTRTGPASYEMLARDGSKLIFSQSDGAIGTSRKIFLTQMLDPYGNAVTLSYDANLRIVAITDAIGQVTTLTYGDTNDIYKITRVTDPFGRFASFDYDSLGRLTNITDVIGLHSQLVYEDTGDFINSLITPYGTTSFTASHNTTDPTRPTRALETVYPDGSRDRVEYITAFDGPPERPDSVPTGIGVPYDEHLAGRTTFYWSRTACATGYGDYSQAKRYQWLHQTSLLAASILESTKEPLEARVWYNYPGQTLLGPTFAGDSSRPTKIGRVLDDGTTQLSTYDYDDFGHVTKSVDPVGRTFSYLYATNGIDLLEIRQTRNGSELLSRSTYNTQHRPLTVVDAAGQTNRFTYNARGQLLTATNPKNEMTSFAYDTNGYLITVDGPLPGTSDSITASYDFFGRVRTMTGVSGYTLTFDYDAMNRVTKITHPDATFEQYTYDRLDLATFRDRAGRQTFTEYDSMRRPKKKTDPLGRVTYFDWCPCGQIESLTDPMGRTTTWHTDVQGRTVAKQYADGSQVRYQYENTTSRLRLKIDEKQQITQFSWNRDDTLRSVTYNNATIPTPSVSFTYGPDYERVTSMTDGTGTTRYSYHPIADTPTLGAGALASLDGPLADDTITFDYDELGRVAHRTINGVESEMSFDAAGRLVGLNNVLGAFSYAYDGPSGRVISNSFPNGQVTERSFGNTFQDLLLQRITHTVGTTPISEFLYGHDVPRGSITTWSQQDAAQPPSLHTFSYDAVNQLLSDSVTNAGIQVNSSAYTYDPAGNRLSEQIGSSNYTATYNGLNEIGTTTSGATRTNEWDALNRLVAVNMGNQRTEFSYDGASRMVAIRKLVNASEVSFRRLVWCGNQICEERDAAGTVTKRFLPQGMKVESGPSAGDYFYTRDHLGSIRELTDGNGNVRARYSYDPYGRRTKVTGDLESDFGFAGMFWAAEANLAITHYRAYDPELGRWLSRDPLGHAEMRQGQNVYAYVLNNPISRIDPEGLCFTTVDCTCLRHPATCAEAGIVAEQGAERAVQFEQTLPGWQPAANAIAQCAQSAGAELPSLENTFLELESVPQIVEAPAVREFPLRVIDLWNKFQTTVTPQDFEIVEEHGFQTDELYLVETEFYELATDFARTENIPFNQAWQRLVDLLGFNPQLWPQP